MSGGTRLLPVLAAESVPLTHNSCAIAAESVVLICFMLLSSVFVHPSAIWRDIAIVTNRPERCAAYKAASQNVLARSYCQWDATHPVIRTKIEQTWQEGWVPITREACESTANPTQWPGGKWIEIPAWNIAAPECVVAPLSRDNHLGNAVPASDTPNSVTGGYTAQYNWTIPSSIASPYCVLRLRYNISTGEFPNQGFDSATTLDSGVDSSVNVIPFNPRSQDNNGRYPAEYPIWLKYGMTRTEVNGSFTLRVQNDDPDDDNNGGRLGGIRKSRPPSRDYTLRNNPQVDIFGDLLSKNISVSGGDPNLVGQPLIRVRLAINTAQFGRTFEDRSHVFEIRARPAALANVVIHNLSVRGKRGNIVQTYPGVEYDFVPDRLHINQGDFVHIQWTGTGSSRDEDEGDKHNIVLQRDAVYFEQGQDWNIGNLTAAGTPKYGHWGSAYPALINDTTQTHFLGLGFTHLRMLALWGINSSHFDLGPLQARAAGEFRYLCTRNNDFSNREQKAMIVVAPNPVWVAMGAAGLIDAPQTVSMTGETSTASGHAILKQAYFDARPDFAPPGLITIEDVPATDPAGEGEQNWFKVLPPVMGLGVEPKSLYLEADRPMPGNFLYKGQLMWKLNADDTAQEVIPNSNFFATRNKFAVQNGGYYQSSSVPNSAMIAGVSLGVAGLICIFLYLYWRVRVQPEGSWKIFCSSRGCNICGKPEVADAEGGVAASDAAPLVSPAAASSSSSAAVVPARV